MVDKLLNCENDPLIQKDRSYYAMTISLVPLTTACHGKRVEQDTSCFHNYGYWCSFPLLFVTIQLDRYLDRRIWS